MKKMKTYNYTDTMIEYLRNYILKAYRPPIVKIKEDTFDNKSYSNFAAMELLERLYSNLDKDPIYVIEKMVDEYDEFALKDDETGTMFAICHDALIDIYDHALSFLLFSAFGQKEVHIGRNNTLYVKE